MKKSRILHISIHGFPGVGKTSLLMALLYMYHGKVQVIQRYTCRPRRPGEEHSLEYHFCSEEQFAALWRGGFFIKRTIRKVVVNGKVYYSAIPKKKYWPEPPEGTELVVSFFGMSAFFLRKGRPEMKLIFISHHSVDRTLVDVKLQVSARCHAHGIDYLSKLRKINRYLETRIWERYDAVAYNDRLAPVGLAVKCAREIKSIIETKKWS